MKAEKAVLKHDKEALHIVIKLKVNLAVKFFLSI